MDAIDLLSRRRPTRRPAPEPQAAADGQLSLLTDTLEPRLDGCDCPRHATCPRCDPAYVERDGDRAAGIVPFDAGPVPYGVIPF